MALGERSGQKDRNRHIVDGLHEKKSGVCIEGLVLERGASGVKCRVDGMQARWNNVLEIGQIG